jgi:hypothetical protein
VVVEVVDSIQLVVEVLVVFYYTEGHNAIGSKNNSRW